MLRKKNRGKQTGWSMENIKAGFEEFFRQHNRYPTARDFDDFDFLPAARSIQRTYGGLLKLRSELKLDNVIDYTVGETRSKTAKELSSNAADYESEFYNYLISLLPEIKVHEHKILRPGNVCCDFFIYKTETTGIAIDLFYAKDIFSLKGIVRIKLARYKNFKFPVYFVLIGNNKISQEEIVNAMSNRKEKLPKNIFVLTGETFKKSILSTL